VGPAAVVLRKVGRAVDAAREEAPAERRVRDERGAELAERGARVLGLGAVEQKNSLWSALIGWTAWARRTVAGAASESPRKRALPCWTSFAIAPTVSSIGTLGSTRCW